MRVPCPQCGAEVPLREAVGFPVCPYCRVSLVLDRCGVRPHFLYRPRIHRPEVLPLLRRWADGQRCPSPVPASPPRLLYYPFWRYRGAGASRFTPAWPTLGAHWDALHPPEAEQIFFDPAEAGEASVVEATVPEASARRRLGLSEDAAAGDLVHVPFFEIDVTLNARQARFVLDACAGRVYTGDGLGAEDMPSPRRHGSGAVAAGALVLAALLLPTVAALPAMAGLAGWLGNRLAAERRVR